VEKPENRGSISVFYAKNERKQAGGCSEKGGGGGTECTATKVAKLCPLILLVKVSAGKVKSWEVKKAG
jgi:hypothetical protein